MSDQASSRTAVRMPTSFMNTNSDHAIVSHNYAVYTADSTATAASTGQTLPVSLGMNRVYMAGEGVEVVRSAIGMRAAHGYYDRMPTDSISSINISTNMAPRGRERAASIVTASTHHQQHAHMPPSTNTPPDCWEAGGIPGTHAWVQHEALQVGPAASPATRWVRLAWEPLVAGEEVTAEPCTSYPPVPLGGRVPVTGGMTAAQGGLPPPLGQYSRQQFGVKRFRAPDEEYSRNIDEQGVEAKRVGSPHRLIRRMPATREERGRERRPTSSAPQSRMMMPSRASGPTLEVGATDQAAMPGAHDELPWAWAGGAHVTGPRRDQGRPSETNNSGQHETEIRGRQWDGASVPGTTLQQQVNMPAHSLSSGGAAYSPAVLSREARGTYRQREAGSSAAESTPQHHSLKVQRLSMGQIDTLASSVEGLGVASPQARGQTAKDGGALENATLTRAYSRWRQTYGESATANSTCGPTSSDVHPPIATGVVQTSIVGPARRGDWMPSGDGASAALANSVGDESKIGGTGAAHASSVGASRSGGGHQTAIVQKAAGTPSANLSMLADNRNPPQSAAPTALPRVDPEPGTAGLPIRGVAAGDGSVAINTGESSQTVDVDHAAVITSRFCAPAAASSEGDFCSRTASRLGRVLQGGKGAPGYDAAVSITRLGATGESTTAEAFASERGDVDDDSSDGGAAHEEISAWLHSTEDWWTS